MCDYLQLGDGGNLGRSTIVEQVKYRDIIAAAAMIAVLTVIIVLVV